MVCALKILRCCTAADVYLDREEEEEEETDNQVDESVYW